MTPILTGDADDDLAALRAEFPNWRIARAGGRWWAACGPILGEHQAAADAVQAATAEEMHARLTARASRRH